MRGRNPDDAIAGAFEELPALLVILIAVSLFSVSFAHAATARDRSHDYLELQEDCLDFARMVMGSETLCRNNPAGTFDISRLNNETGTAFLEEFNSTAMGFDYLVSIQVIGDSSSAVFNSTLLPDFSDIAAFHTCANVDMDGRTGAARVTVSIWRPA